MRYVRCQLEEQVLRAAKGFPLRGADRTTLRRLFPKASYFLLEDPDVVARLRADPQGFLDAVPMPAILDEVQNVPDVFAFVRSRIDRWPRRAGVAADAGRDGIHGGPGGGAAPAPAVMA